jgi:hypothetical protein
VSPFEIVPSVTPPSRLPVFAEELEHAAALPVPTITTMTQRSFII